MIRPMSFSSRSRRALERISSRVSAGVSSIQIGQPESTPAARASMVKSESLNSAPPHPLAVDPGLGAQHPLHQLLLRHLQREDRDASLRLDRGVGRDVEAEGGLPHGRPSGDDDQLRPLEPRGHLVQVYEAGRNPGNPFAALLERFDALHRGPQHFLEPGESFGVAVL